MSRARLIVLLLALGTLLIYWPATRCGFINYDDGDYVTENPHVQNGLTRPDVEWAFTTFHAANWHPLTWLSHMTDCELFGLNPSAQHAVNVLLHAANVVLLFVWVQRFANSLWVAAFVAALFGWHPLRVESVAWISERKDVLSAFFALLTLIFYERFVSSSKIKNSKSKIFYAAALFLFACGLMSKPMLVTLPFVMLLFDFWPLQRFNRSTVPRLLVEKIPFFALAAASCAVTYIAQSHGAVKSLQAVPLGYRLENVPVAFAGYLWKIIYPAHLAIIYPMPRFIPLSAVFISVAVLILITVAVWRVRRTNSFLLMGSLWFLGTLVPVIGVVKVGDAAMADRYTYIPSIGLFIAVVFGVEKILRTFSISKTIPAIAAILIVGSCVALTERQLTFWRDNKTLFGHALQVTKDNADAEINYGAALEQDGDRAGALAHYRRAVNIAPGSVQAHTDLANLLDDTGHPDEALREFQTALKINPRSVATLNNYGTFLAELGRYDNAIRQYAAAMRLDADDWHAPFLTGKTLLKQGNDSDAIPFLKKALSLSPDNLQVLDFSAQVLASDEKPEARDGQTALQLAQKANALTGGSQPAILDTLAMANAGLGRFDDALTIASNALAMAEFFNATNKIEEIQRRIELYKNHQPFRQSFTNAPAKKLAE